MTAKPVRFAREARIEALEAGRWYEGQRRGLGAEFIAALDVAIDRVGTLGSRLQLAPGVDPALGVRRLQMRRFPFHVFFMELPTRIRVLAIAHQRRRPYYWRGRLP